MSCETTQLTNIVTDTVKFIYRLQLAAVSTSSVTMRCNTAVLGETSNANTRPFILYLPDGQPFKLTTLSESGLTPIPVFRVEEVKDNYATLRALAYPTSRCSLRETTTSTNVTSLNTELVVDDPFDEIGFERNHRRNETFIPTRTCCTVNLNSFIGIQCLDDIYVALESCR